MAAKLLGSTTPRLYTPPLRPLTRRSSRGFEVADFAEQVIGEPLLPWQRWAAIHAMELLPSGIFRFRKVLIVVARQNGKSHLKRAISLWRMYMEPGSQILGVAQEVKLARKQWGFCQDSIHASPQLEKEFAKARNVNGDEYFWLTNGSLYAIGAASPKSGRGSSNDEVNIDELREQTDWRAWAALSKTTNARPNPQIWCMSNAGHDGSVVLNQLQDAGQAGRDETLGVFEWSAPDGCELGDPRAWRQSNPGLGYIITERTLRSDLGTDPPDIFRTEVLCQRVRNLNSAIDMGAWRDTSDDSGTITARDRVAACFEIAEDGQHATLVAAAVTADGFVRVETVRAWNSTEQARRELDGELDRVKPRAIAWFPTGPGGAFAPILRRRRQSIELGGTKVSEACMGLAALIIDRQVLHPDDALLAEHLGDATKLDTGDGWRFTRKDAGHVDAAYAAAGAAYAAQTLPAPRRPQIRVMSA